MAAITVTELWAQIMTNASFLYPTRDDIGVVVSCPSDKGWEADLVGEMRFTETNSFVAFYGTPANTIEEAYKNLLKHISFEVMRCLTQKINEESGLDHAENGLNHVGNGLDHAVNGLNHVQ